MNTAIPRPQTLSPALTLLMSAATGLMVASNYYAQPLLDAIANAFMLSPNQAGFIVTTAQLSYAVGLLLLVPLGDMLERRGLIIGMSLLSAAGMLLYAADDDYPFWARARKAGCSIQFVQLLAYPCGLHRHIADHYALGATRGAASRPVDGVYLTL